MRKFKNHDHLTEKYGGTAHSYCNINYKNPVFLSVYIHNLVGYDAHFLLKN